MRVDLRAAAHAWDVSNENLDQINRRIHDQASDLESLVQRADRYVAQMRALFPYVDWDFDLALEIGSGVGFIMEALRRSTTRGERTNRVTGLDISRSMVEKAKQRLGQSADFTSGKLTLSTYDGVTFPFGDRSFDLIYSVAALQHIPKPFVYNLLFEIKRVLRPDGHAILHFLPFTSLKYQEKMVPWRNEISNQITNTQGPHWHHFYSREELEAVLEVTGFAHIHITPDIYTCLKTTPIALPKTFSREGYLAKHADIGRANADPAEHYLRHGWREGRSW
jgi:SAM-dependent methyltransferase